MKRTERSDFEQASLDPERIGSSFQEWLVEEGLDGIVQEAAVGKRLCIRLEDEKQGSADIP